MNSVKFFSKASKSVTWLLALLVSLHLMLLMSLQFTAWPEMFSFPYLLNLGYSLYNDMVHPYPPVLTMALSFIYSLVGYSPFILKVLTWSLIILNDILIYSIVLLMTKKKLPALAAVIFYVLVQPFLEGNMLWFDTAIVTPLLLGVFFLLKQSKYSLFWSGVCFALAGGIKQTGGLFFIIVFLFLLLTKVKLKEISVFIGGLVFVWLPIILYLLLSNQFGNFWNWVIYYPSSYWTSFPGYVAMGINMRQMLLILFLLLPSSILLVRKKTHQIWLTLLLVLIGIVGVYPRFSFFHFQPALAFISLTVGILFSKSGAFKSLAVAYFILTLIAVWIPGRRNFGKETRFLETSDYLNISNISSKISSGEKIYLLGLPSHYYVFTNTLPPKPWVDNYGWYYEIPGYQDFVISMWENDHPKYVLIKPFATGNWYDIGVYKPKKVIGWIQEHYKEEQMVEDTQILKRL